MAVEAEIFGKRLRQLRLDAGWTQEQLADASGLTAVHVNRTLKSMDADGLIRREKRFILIPDWEKLRSVAGFSELYLHLDQVAA